MQNCAEQQHCFIRATKLKMDQNEYIENINKLHEHTEKDKKKKNT